MNISKAQQRVLHVLALGGKIQHHRDERGRVVHIDCLTREGHRLETCDLPLFAKLRTRRLIASRGGGPYRISREGLLASPDRCFPAFEAYSPQLTCRLRGVLRDYP